MILFFDRSVGTAIPLSLIDYLKPREVTIEYHDLHFAQGELDDVWLPVAAENEWIVIGHDHSYHINSPELEAIKDYGLGAFYLWGAMAPKWSVMRCFAAAYDKVLNAAAVTPKPFIYRVEKHGGLNELYVPLTIKLGGPRRLPLVQRPLANDRCQEVEKEAAGGESEVRRRRLRRAPDRLALIRRAPEITGYPRLRWSTITLTPV